MLSRDIFEKKKTEIISLLSAYKNIPQIEKTTNCLECIYFNEKNPVEAYRDCFSLLFQMKKVLERKTDDSFFVFSPVSFFQSSNQVLLPEILKKAKTNYLNAEREQLELDWERPMMMRVI